MVTPVQKYHARFHGRAKGALGVFHDCEAFTEGATEDAARLALYNDYEHISVYKLTPLVLRYTPTHINADALRTLIMPAQGRYMFETEAEAQIWIDAMRDSKNNNPVMLQRLYGDLTKIEVRPVWCWPTHHDPIGVYFD